MHSLAGSLTYLVLSLLVVTDPENPAWYTGSIVALKSMIHSVESLAVKTACISALGSIMFFSTVVDETELDHILDFLLDIVTSDGSCIQATDSDIVVSTTINVFGFLVSKMNDAFDVAQK